MLFGLCVRFLRFCLGSGGWVAACWEVASRSAFGVFSECGCLIVNLVFPTSVFGVEVFI